MLFYSKFGYGNIGQYQKGSTDTGEIFIETTGLLMSRNYTQFLLNGITINQTLTPNPTTYGKDSVTAIVGVGR